MDVVGILAIAAVCAPQVSPGTALAIVKVESNFNPWAIGVVGGALERQARSRAEALAAARALRQGGWNFSLGLGQINVHNLDRLGLSVESAFDPCANLAAMQSVLLSCFDHATGADASVVPQQTALRRALSCYYSGNFTTGFAHGYVHKVVAMANAQANPPRNIKHTKEST